VKFSIVDIETTGGSAKKHEVTEIAIIQIENGKIIDTYETLVNPGVLIPGRITAITGITNEMVESAPAFQDVASEIWKRTNDSVFVAHNVNFDYSFIREQFHRLGMHWRTKRLCTVRLSRKLMPNLYSYSLGKIAAQMGEKIDGRHRAMGDCAFTAKLFLKLQALDHEDQIPFALNARSREATLPPLLNRERFEEVPSVLGVYIFKGAKGKVLYVGKANDLKKRVSEHFRGNTHTGFKSHFAEKIEDLDWIVCPNELIALLTEANEIKKHWPPYNRLMKRVTLNWGVYRYVDQNGYQRLNIGRVGKWDRPEYSFRSRFDAQIRLEFLCQKHRLCARFCGLQDAAGACDPHLHGLCNKACVGEESAEDYNARCEEAVAELRNHDKTMLITGKGFTEQERSVVLIEAGRYKGHGMVPMALDLSELDEVKSFIETGYDDQDMQAVILSHISRSKEVDEVILL